MTHTLTYDDYLAHYGVQGMKWGVRRGDTSKSNKTSYVDGVKDRYKQERDRPMRSVTVKTKNGVEVVAKEIRTLKMAAFIEALKPKGSTLIQDNPNFNIYADGELVGDSAFSKKPNGEMNLVWLGINPKHRGKGYASAVFDAAVAYGKSEGSSKLTLEVPGNAPDARHIYEQRGFVVTKEPTKKEISKDLVWGGLTHMALDLNSVRHAESEDDLLEKAFAMTFPEPPEDVLKEIFEHEDRMTHTLTYDDYLAHYGVKGMKWGVKRNSQNGSGGSETKKPRKPLDKKKLAKRVGVGLAIGATVAIGAAAATHQYKSGVKKTNTAKFRDISTKSMWDMALPKTPAPKKQPKLKRSTPFAPKPTPYAKRDKDTKRMGNARMRDIDRRVRRGVPLSVARKDVRKEYRNDKLKSAGLRAVQQYLNR